MYYTIYLLYTILYLPDVPFSDQLDSTAEFHSLPTDYCPSSHPQAEWLVDLFTTKHSPNPNFLHFLDAIHAMVTTAICDMESYILCCALVLARHCAQEGSHLFPSYKDWFQVNLSQMVWSVRPTIAQ